MLRDDNKFDELLDDALQSYGAPLPEGIADRVLEHAAARRGHRLRWRPAAAAIGLAAAAALALVVSLHRPEPTQRGPLTTAALVAAHPEDRTAPPAQSLRHVALRAPRRIAVKGTVVGKTASPDEGSRPFPVIPASPEEQQFALALLHHKDELTAELPDKAASIQPIKISAIRISPVEIAAIPDSPIPN